MKKLLWVVGGTIAMIIAILFCEYVNIGTKNVKIQFLVKGQKPINVWEESNSGSVYVFLPAYARLEDTTVRLTEKDEVLLDNIPLASGMDCSAFELNQKYRLVKGGIEKDLYFLRSDHVATMYIDTASRTMNDVHGDKQHREYAHIELYTTSGELEYRSRSVDQIRGRGNTTWSNFAKKPYNLYLRGKQSLLNMPAADEWVLLANTYDETNLRNKVTADFARKIQSKDGFAADSRYVSLYLNGNFAGLYLLSEKVENLAKRYMKHSDDLLFCIQNELGKINDYHKVVRLMANHLFAEISQPSAKTQKNKDMLERLLTIFEINLNSDGLPEYIDTDSWARKYLVEEIFGNLDADESSQYFYFNSASNKIYAGPCWDYDLAIGSKSAYKLWWSPNSIYAQKNWYKALMSHEEFYNEVIKIYQNEGLPAINRMLKDDILQLAELLRDSIKVDSVRWPDLYYADPVKSIEDFYKLVTDHVSFLSSFWLTNENYCKVTFLTENLFISRYPFYVKCGVNVSELPKPEEIGVDGGKEWYDQKGKPFHQDNRIEKDIILYNQPPSDSDVLEQKVGKVVPRKISLLSMKDVDGKAIVLMLIGLAGGLMILIGRLKGRRK